MSVCECTSRYSARAFTPLCHNPACTYHSVDYTDKKQGRTQSGKYCSKCSARYCSQQCYQTDRFRHEMRQCDIRESLIELTDVCGGETPKNKSLIMTKVIGALKILVHAILRDSSTWPCALNTVWDASQMNTKAMKC